MVSSRNVKTIIGIILGLILIIFIGGVFLFFNNSDTPSINNDGNSQTFCEIINPNDRVEFRIYSGFEPPENDTLELEIRIGGDNFGQVLDYRESKDFVDSKRNIDGLDGCFEFGFEPPIGIFVKDKPSCQKDFEVCVSGEF